MTKKEIAKLFLQMAGSGMMYEAFEKCPSKDFIHHTQYFEGNREALSKAMAETYQTNSNKHFEINIVS